MINFSLLFKKNILKINNIFKEKFIVGIVANKEESDHTTNITYIMILLIFLFLNLMISIALFQFYI